MPIEATNPVRTDEHDFTPVKSADRTLDVLESLAGGGATRRARGAPRHTEEQPPQHPAHARTSGLGRDRRVALHPQPGIGARLIGSSYVDQDPTVIRTSEIMDRLAAETGETVHLARLELPDVVYLATGVGAPASMFSAIGRRLPAHATALGKAALAELPDDKVRALLPATLASSTPRTITSREALIEHLAEVRRVGFAVDDEEAGVGMRCFAVCLPFQSSSKDAISCSVPIARLDAAKEHAIVEALLSAREELSQQFGRRRAVI